jgi:hypothetical protein
MDSAVLDSAPARQANADGSWMAWTAAGVGGIWVAVSLISVFARDMVTGSEQQHLPVALLTSWFWGSVATAALLWAMGRIRRDAAARPIWSVMAVATLALWLAATVIAIGAPVVETGSDPTQIPVGAVVAPVAAAALTVLAAFVAALFARSPDHA